MKQTIIVNLTLFTAIYAKGQLVDLELAKTVAKNFYSNSIIYSIHAIDLKRVFLLKDNFIEQKSNPDSINEPMFALPDYFEALNITIGFLYLSNISTGISNNFYNSNIKLFPNPTNRFITIEFLETLQNYTLEIHNSLGQLIIQKESSNQTEKIIVN